VARLLDVRFPLVALLALAAALRLGYRPEVAPLLRVLGGGALAALALALLKRGLPLGFVGGLGATALVITAALLLTRAASLRELEFLLARRPRG